MKLFFKGKGIEDFCTALELEVFVSCLINDVTKSLTGESYFEKSNSQLRRTLINMPDNAVRDKISRKTSSPPPADLDRLKIARDDKLTKVKLCEIMIRSCERLYALPEIDQEYLRPLLLEVMLWRDLGKKIEYSGQDYLIYTANVVWWAGQILGGARMLKVMKEEESCKMSNLPSRRGKEFRAVVMEEADKLGIQSSKFGSGQGKLRKIFIGNVNSRFPEVASRTESHILAELRKGLRERKEKKT